VEGLDFNYEDTDWNFEYQMRIDRLHQMCKSEEYKPKLSIIEREHSDLIRFNPIDLL